MDTNDMIFCLHVVTGDPAIQDAFNQGMTWGFLTVAGCIGIAMVRAIGDGGDEEL